MATRCCDPQQIQPGDRPAVRQTAGPHDGQHLLVTAQRAPASGKEAERARNDVAVAADDGTHLAGHAGQLDGPPPGIGLRDLDLGHRPVQGHHLGGSHLRITSEPLSAINAESGIAQPDELVPVPANRPDG